MAANHQTEDGPRQRNPQFQEHFDAPARGSSIVDGGGTTTTLTRVDSTKSITNTLTPSKGGTLKKRNSLGRKSSLKRSGSRRSSHVGSVRSLGLADGDRFGGEDGDESNSVFATPVPTIGSPTDILANRFQGWRKVLKDLIAYFREIQTSYEQRSKSLLKVTNVINNTSPPAMFMHDGGINEATNILRDFHRQAFAEGNKAKEMETGVISQLTGLRGDLTQKIKEIKGLSGDFKNSVEKEMESTRRAVRSLQEALDLAETDPSAVAGKGDPFIVKLSVERQVERQIDEENYLHRAYLNLEGSGRELDSIVVGEIQKAYNAYAGILKREADEACQAVERLRAGPIAMPKDQEWSSFVERDEHFVDPRVPLRGVQDIEYPGRLHPLAAEVRAGMLERKSKYLKSYTPGWYVLTATHLHEFKSPDRISSQSPVMSLYLPEQKLGTHSQPDSTSHKFMLKGRQTGTMHRGHSWVFRAESHDTMLAWFGDLRSLTEKTGPERNAFVRRHARSVSNGSQKAGSISSDGALDEDEADQVPYSASASVNQEPQQAAPTRPQPGGRFPSDLQIDRGLLAQRSPSESSDPDRDVIAAAGALPGSNVPERRDQPHGDDLAGIDSVANDQSWSGEGGMDSRQPTRPQPEYFPVLTGAASPAHEVNHYGPDSYGGQQMQEQRPSGQANPYTYPIQNENVAYREEPDTAGDAIGPGLSWTGVEAHQQDQVERQDDQREGHEIGSSTTVPSNHEQEEQPVFESMTRSESSISAQHHTTSTSAPSQVGGASTVPSTIDISTEEIRGLANSERLTQNQDMAAAPAQEPANCSPSTTASKPDAVAPALKSKDSERDGNVMHVPGEYPPTPAS